MAKNNRQARAPRANKPAQDALQTAQDAQDAAPAAPASVGACAAASGVTLAPRAAATPTASPTRTRDATRSHMQSYAPVPATRKWPTDGKKTRRVLDALLSTVDGLTVSDIADMLQCTNAYARTWLAPSYLRLYGVGIAVQHDTDGLVRAWGARMLADGAVTCNPAMTADMRAAVTPTAAA